MESESLSTQLKQIIEQVKVYFNLRISYMRLNIAEFLIRFFSGLVLWTVIFLFLFFVLVFSSFAFAYWFGDLTGNMALGFLIVAGMYIFLALIIYLLRRKLLLEPFTRMIITQMELDKLNTTGDEKEEQ